MNTQHKVGCVDLGCPGCDATNPRPNPRQPACPQCGGLHVGSTGCPYAETVCDVCHKTLLQHPGYCFCEGGKTEHQPSVTEPVSSCPQCGSTEKNTQWPACYGSRRSVHPWHNAAQPEPREEVMPNENQQLPIIRGATEVSGAAHPNETLKVANTPQPDLEERQKAWEFAWSKVKNVEPEVLAANKAICHIWFNDGYDSGLAARRLSPDRKLVEQMLRECGMPDDQIRMRIEAALKTQEPASPQTRKEGVMPETKPPVSQTKTAEQFFDICDVTYEGYGGKIGDATDWLSSPEDRLAACALMEAYAESERAALREQLEKAQDDYHDQVLTLKNTIAMAEAAEAKLAASECIASKIKIERDEFCRQLTGYQTVENELRKMMGDRKGWPTIDLLRKTLERVEASERIAEGLRAALQNCYDNRFEGDKIALIVQAQKGKP